MAATQTENEQLDRAIYFIQQCKAKNAGQTEKLSPADMVQFLLKQHYEKETIIKALKQESIAIPSTLQPKPAQPKVHNNTTNPTNQSQKIQSDNETASHQKQSASKPSNSDLIQKQKDTICFWWGAQFSIFGAIASFIGLILLIIAINVNNNHDGYNDCFVGSVAEEVCVGDSTRFKIDYVLYSDSTRNEPFDNGCDSAMMSTKCSDDENEIDDIYTRGMYIDCWVNGNNCEALDIDPADAVNNYTILVVFGVLALIGFGICSYKCYYPKIKAYGVCTYYVCGAEQLRIICGEK